ncbi:MAG: TetR/AcrR family transcriptional regulator [Cyanobacteria bacterium P01_A01_bin.105]
MTSGTPADTKAQILNATEALIAERGYAGTTVRNIVQQAGVNLAAVHYHFGSKEDLFRAVFSRISSPMVEAQLALLAAAGSEQQSASTAAILTAFLKPPIQQLVQNATESRIVRAQFMGRCWSEPEPVQTIAFECFRTSRVAFIKALQQALPHQSEQALHWKLDMVIATLIRLTSDAGKPRALLQGTRDADIDQAIEQLVAFLTPGMAATDG